MQFVTSRVPRAWSAAVRGARCASPALLLVDAVREDSLIGIVSVSGGLHA